jgi:hypothetical protein
MPAYSDSFSLPSPSHESSSWLLAGFLVVALHGGLLAIGAFWNPAAPPPKARAKVMVQTVRLAPSPAAIEVQHQQPVPQATRVQQPLIAALQEEPPSPPVSISPPLLLQLKVHLNPNRNHSHNHNQSLSLKPQQNLLLQK